MSSKVYLNTGTCENVFSLIVLKILALIMLGNSHVR